MGAHELEGTRGSSSAQSKAVAGNCFGLQGALLPSKGMELRVLHRTRG